MDLKKGSLTALVCLAFAGLSNAQSQEEHQRRTPPTTAEVLEKMDTDKDGKISEQETQGPLKKDFAEIDTNKDGYLSAEELDKAPKPSRDQQRPQGNHQRQAPRNTAEVLKRMDMDKDGKVSQQEAQGHLKRDFAKIDANKDEYLSTKELDKAPKSNRKQPPNTDDVLRRADTDKDGKVSQQEAQGPLKKDFAKIDADKDGFLSAEELGKAPKPPRNQQASQGKHQRQKPRNTAEVLKKMDMDKDGKVSQQEAQGHLKRDFAKIDANKDEYLSTKELDKAPKPCKRCNHHKE